jgi:hypothetical protein
MDTVFSLSENETSWDLVPHEKGTNIWGHMYKASIFWYSMLTWDHWEFQLWIVTWHDSQELEIVQRVKVTIPFDANISKSHPHITMISGHRQINYIFQVRICKIWRTKGIYFLEFWSNVLQTNWNVKRKLCLSGTEGLAKRWSLNYPLGTFQWRDSGRYRFTRSGYIEKNAHGMLPN